MSNINGLRASTAKMLPFLMFLSGACSSDSDKSTDTNGADGKPTQDSGVVEDDDGDDEDGDKPTSIMDSGQVTIRDAGPGSKDGGPSVSTGGGSTTDTGTAGPMVEDKACAPADKLPEATMLANPGTGAKPVGTYEVVAENDPGLVGLTVYRPDPIGAIKHPIFAWGNGGCMKSTSGFAEFLLQIASQGILVLADGSPGGSGSSSSDGAQLIKGIDWAEKENERPCSKYYHKLDLTKVAVSGQSCGGLMAINASADKRVTTSMPMNSGLMARDTALYGKLHGPMGIINGGPDDIAYANGKADFEAISTIPIMMANWPVGHGGTYREDNGGEMGKAAVGWVRWHLLGDEGATGKGLFTGTSCGLCGGKWEILWKMEPK